MPAPIFRHLCYAALAAAFVLPGCALADSAETYLTWQNKTSATPEPQSDEPSAAMAYPAPPSPYGQVGDPFRRNLNWPAKKAPQTVSPPAPKPQANIQGPTPYQPSPAQPVQAIASRPDTPREMPRSVTVQPLPPKPAPQVMIVEPTPPPPPVLSVAKPAPVLPPHQTYTSTASMSAPTPLPAAKPVVVPPKAVVAAATPKPDQKPAAAAVPAATNDGYQVPANSKYAAQIKAARAAQARDEARDAARQPPEAQKQDQATAPEPSEQLAVHETDHVFIPGETYKDAGDAPRLYSLHRMYGLQPDPITVSPDATGAILDGADLHADEAAPKTPAKETATKSGNTSKAKPEGK
jgi:hypothetical protein